MSLMHGTVIRPNAEEVQFHSAVSALLVSDGGVLVASAAFDTFASLATNRPLDLMRYLKKSEFDRLSECALQRLSSVCCHAVFIFVFHLCITTGHMDEFCKKFFGSSLRAALEWVCRVGTIIEHLDGPADLIESQWRYSTALVWAMCSKYRRKFPMFTSVQQTGLAFLQRALCLCKGDECAAHIIFRITDMITAKTTTPDMLSRVLSRGIVDGEISKDVELFLYRYLCHSARGSEDFVFDLRPELIGALAATLMYRHTHRYLSFGVNGGNNIYIKFPLTSPHQNTVYVSHPCQGG